jgi:hypothetical protein
MRILPLQPASGLGDAHPVLATLENFFVLAKLPQSAHARPGAVEDAGGVHERKDRPGIARRFARAPEALGLADYGAERLRSTPLPAMRSATSLPGVAEGGAPELDAWRES